MNNESTSLEEQTPLISLVSNSMASGTKYDLNRYQRPTYFLRNSSVFSSTSDEGPPYTAMALSHACRRWPVVTTAHTARVCGAQCIFSVLACTAKLGGTD